MNFASNGLLGKDFLAKFNAMKDVQASERCEYFGALKQLIGTLYGSECAQSASGSCDCRAPLTVPFHATMSCFE
jgi:hypothetical protein